MCYNVREGGGFMINGEKKGSTLYVLEILRKYTDRNHSLTYSQILDKLEKEMRLFLKEKRLHAI